MSDPDHPVWPFLRIIFSMICLTIVLVMSASHFDATETYAICAMFVLQSGNEYAIRILSYWRKMDEKD